MSLFVLYVSFSVCRGVWASEWCLCLWLDRYCASVEASALEDYDAVNESVECVILADAYVLAWVVLCTALANEDVASLDYLTSKMLKSESF